MSRENDIDIQRRFGGIQRLYGAAGFERLQRAHVCVIGIGGVGSWAAEALARSAIGEITLVDLDHVAESNTNRQIQAVEGNYGKAKVDAMAERVLSINPLCRVNRVEAFIAPDNLPRLLLDRGYDHLIDCIDSFRVKAALIAFCRRNRLRVITTGGAGGKRDPLAIRRADLSRTEQDTLLARTRRLLRREYGFSRNPRRRFDIPCLYSPEQPVFPDASGGVCHAGGVGDSGLNCGGYGSVTSVTAAFGLAAVSYVLARLAVPAQRCDPVVSE
ncbi:MAG: tRNA threonylcarbamoyladenosine dehydratase [Candidatus Sedimenticola endophacoides]